MEIKVATTMEELKEIGALRYNVFVREQGYSPPFADTTTGLLLEPEDSFNQSTVAYVKENTDVVASIRVEHSIPNWLSFQLDAIPDNLHNLKCCFMSRAYSIATSRGRYFDALQLWLAEKLAQNYEVAITAVIKPEIIDLDMQYAFQPTGYMVKHRSLIPI